MNDTLLIHPDAQILLNQLVAKPPHAVVLAGAKGIGKTLIGRQVTEQLLGKPIASGNNPYYQELIPIKNTISIEQVRTLIKFFQLSVPGTAKIKRVALLQDADLMGIEAQNALLKLLEEPPAGSVLLLTTSNLPGLLPTIQSRARLISLPSPAPDMISAHFASLGHAPANVQKATLRHGSNLAAIIASLNGDSATADSSLDLVKQALRGTSFDRLLLVDTLAKQKERTNEFAETLAAVASASLVSAAKRGGDALERWQNILQAAHTAQEALLRSGNAKLVLTELMLNL